MGLASSTFERGNQGNDQGRIQVLRGKRRLSKTGLRSRMCGSHLPSGPHRSVRRCMRKTEYGHLMYVLVKKVNDLNENLHSLRAGRNVDRFAARDLRGP